ncbi:Ger(x)C family spore germination protein [Paenibacillaceae bacterium WGS1546]|uniref:Ger(x)C family spore germination protein n=1 Tax=Cohnella sp. WGS1546 TaxID=3366810 RepID=UPI00372D4CAA
MNVKLRGIAALTALAVLCGCWDRIEIEERGFVVGTAIDLTESGAFELTFQFAIPGAMLEKTPEAQSSDQTYQNVSAEGETLFRAARKMANKSSRVPYMEHNKLIIVSEKLAREGRIEEALDLFIRDHEMRRSSKVLVAKGQAKKLLTIRPRIERLPVEYINATSENPDKSETITPPAIVGHLHRNLLEEHSYAIPVISAMDNKASVSGAAVFHGPTNKLKGFLSGIETSGGNFFNGTIRAGVVEIEYEGEPIVFEIKDVNRRLRADVADPEHPVFDVEISAEGNVGESYSKADLLNPSVIAEIERKVNERVRDVMESTLDKVQREYRSDVLGFGDHLRENHYRTWETVKDDWEEGKQIFSRCNVNIRVRSKIRIVGAIDRAKN